MQMSEYGRSRDPHVTYTIFSYAHIFRASMSGKQELDEDDDEQHTPDPEGRQLNSQEMTWMRSKHNSMKRDAEPFGYQSLDPCNRLRPDRYKHVEDNRNGGIVKDGPSWLMPYWIAFVDTKGWIPQPKKYYVDEAPLDGHPIYCELSHVCGDNTCFEPTHIVLEKKTENIGRERCHKELRKHVQDSKHDNLGNTTEETQELRKRITEDSSLRGLITAARAGITCSHKPQCFINVGDASAARRARGTKRKFQCTQKWKRVTVEEFKRLRKGKSVKYRETKGWVEKKEGDRIQFCSYDGSSRKKTKCKWVGKNSTHLTIPCR